LASVELIAQPLGLVPYRKANVWGYSNLAGNIIIPPTYEKTFFFTGDKVARVKQNGIYGFINEKGEFVLPPIYTDATDFYLGIARVTKDSKSYCINLDGAEDECFEEEEMMTEEEPIDEDLPTPFVIETINGKYKVIVNATGDTIPTLFDHVEEIKKSGFLQSNYFLVVTLNGLKGAFDENGNILAPVKYKALEIFDVDSYKAVEKQLWGVVRNDQSMILPFVYESIEKISDIQFGDDRIKKSEYYIVKKKEKTGVVDRENKTVIKFDYDEITSPRKCSCALEFLVRKNGLVGIMDEKGNMLAPVNYSSIEPFGAATVTKVKTTSGKEGYINKNGVTYFSE